MGGGRSNTASAVYGSVFGGSGSSAAHNFAGVFGQNVGSTFANTMHVEALALRNVPAVGTAVACTVSFAYIGTPLGAAQILVWS